MKKIRFLGLEECLVGLLLIIVFLSVVLQVVNRFLIGASIPWTEELARYAFIWLSFIGISCGVKRQSHMAVDFMVKKFSKKVQSFIAIIVDGILLLLFLLSAIYGYQLAFKMLSLGQKSPALQLEMGYVYLAAPIGLTLASIRLLQNNFNKIQKKEG